MAAILMDIGPVTALNADDQMVKFKPTGALIEVGDAREFFTRNMRKNPIAQDESAPSRGVRMLVGFNVGIVKTWTMKDVVDIVFRLRRRQVADAIKGGYAKPHPQGGDVGATFIAQSGLWQQVHVKKPYPEPGAQVVIMNIIHERHEEFRKDMVEIAEELARKLKQQAVMLELQEHGVTKRTLTIVG